MPAGACACCHRCSPPRCPRPYGRGIPSLQWVALAKCRAPSQFVLEKGAVLGDGGFAHKDTFPGRQTISPSVSSASSALRTVMRLTPKRFSNSVSIGSMSPGAILASISCCKPPLICALSVIFMVFHLQPSFNVVEPIRHGSNAHDSFLKLNCYPKRIYYGGNRLWNIVDIVFRLFKLSSFD